MYFLKLLWFYKVKGKDCLENSFWFFIPFFFLGCPEIIYIYFNRNILHHHTPYFKFDLSYNNPVSFIFYSYLFSVYIRGRFFLLFFVFGKKHVQYQYILLQHQSEPSFQTFGVYGIRINGRILKHRCELLPVVQFVKKKSQCAFWAKTISGAFFCCSSAFSVAPIRIFF